MRCREADDPFTKLGQYLFALHSLAARFSRMITPGAGGCRSGELVRTGIGQAGRPVLQEALDLIAEAGVDPTDGDQEQAEDDEADDPRQRFQVAQVPEEELQRADQKQGEAGEAEHAIAQGESDRKSTRLNS